MAKSGSYLCNKISKKQIRAVVAIMFAFLAWETLERQAVLNPIFFSSPSRIAVTGWQMLSSGILWPHFAVSIFALLSGFLLAVFVGVIIGMFVASGEKIYDYLNPYVVILSSTPLAAVVPLIIIWFGIGVTSKIATVFLMALMPIMISAIDGTKNVDKKITEMAISFGAHKFFVTRKVTFFAVLPFIFSGARIAVGRAIAGLIISEAFGYGKGLGYLVVFYGTSFNTSRLYFIIFILLSIAMFLTKAILLIERSVIKFKK